MLTELFVRNFAIIDEIRFQFQSGLSVLSGETGAGKSLLVGSLGLIAGERASPSMVRTGEREATIEALFDIKGDGPLQEYLEDAGLSEGHDLIIRRLLSVEGRGRIFVNGKSISLSQLQPIGRFLIDLAGQHDQQVLLNEENHISLLDGSHPLGSQKLDPLRELLNSYQGAYFPFREKLASLEEFKRACASRGEKIDYLSFQYDEIRRAELTDDEEEDKLLSEKAKVKNADFLAELVGTAEERLKSGEGSALEAVDSMLERVKKASGIDAALDEGRKILEEARAPLSEAALFFARYGQGMSGEPGRLEAIESRLYQIHQLKKKYGSTIAEVRSRLDVIEKELRHLENSDVLTAQRESEVNELGKKLLSFAKTLSQVRRKRAAELEVMIQKELFQLSIPKVKFKILVSATPSPTAQDCQSHGIDRVLFYLSANPGEPPQPLAQIASGGELSRVLLAIKKVLHGSSKDVTFVFDEIDSGIGGAVAEVVGRKLKAMAREGQVIVVTHLPQIASHADGHYVIEKNVRGGRTVTGVRTLDDPHQREEEIARMLGGVTITSKTREHAKEMLKGVGS